MNGLGILALFALRYAGKRETGASLAVVNSIKMEWPRIAQIDRERIYEELGESHHTAVALIDYADLRKRMTREVDKGR